jgi:hypothetical protein
VAGSDTETQLPIGVAALPILAIESATDRGEYRQAAGAIGPSSDVGGAMTNTDEFGRKSVVIQLSVTPVTSPMQI